MLHTLRRKFTLICATCTSIVLLILSFLSLGFNLREQRTLEEKNFRTTVTNIRDYITPQTYVDHLWLFKTETTNHVFIGLYADETPLLYTLQNETREMLTASAIKYLHTNYAGEFQRDKTKQLPQQIFYFPLAQNDSQFQAAAFELRLNENWITIIVLQDLALGAQTRAHTIALFLALSIISLALLILFAWLFSGWAIRPIEQSQKNQNDFISAASHELRSPLAVMQVSAGAIKTASSEKVQEFATLIEKECSRLSHLTDDLLKLAGADSQHLSIEFSNTEPETLLLRTYESHELLASEKQLRLSVRLPEQALPLISCDATRIEQILFILIDNAISYTPKNGQIELILEQTKQSVRFHVIDSGHGIPDAEKETIFKRFYRGDTSRTKKEHYGLGLSIAKEIAKLHDGSLTVTDSVSGGADFCLSLPLRRKEK